MNFKIGVDGGGTKTELILVDSAGAVVAAHTAPGCNPSQTGPEKAREILQTGLAALLGESKIENPKPKIAATHLYMAGASQFWSECAWVMPRRPRSKPLPASPSFQPSPPA